MTTFTNAIAREIEARFNDGRQFTKFDLVHISNAAGKDERAITHVLRGMVERGTVRLVGEFKTRSGGTRASKVYVRAPANQVPQKQGKQKLTTEEFYREMRVKEAYLNECGIRLHEVLDGMTRATVGV